MSDPPALEEHFVPTSVWGLIRRRHPYDFVETYETLREVYGYGAYYANLGCWPEGAETVEPGRVLTLRVADALQLAPQDALIDAGSGLGQAAVDLAERHDLSRVVGINPNPRQVAFANALAAAAGLGERVQHRQGDACRSLADLPEATFAGVLALECIGHFPRPDDFLRDAWRALAPGGRIAFCLNVAQRPASALERLSMQVAYGFSPAPLQRWRERLERAGFSEIEDEDLTQLVLEPMSTICLARLKEAHDLPALSRWGTGYMLRRVRAAVAAGRLGYARVSARKPL